MSEEMNSTPPRDSIARGYEDTRLSPKWLGIFVAGFVLVAVVSHVALWYLMKAVANNPRVVDRPRSAIALPADHLDGSPPLQPSVAHDRPPEQDLASLRHHEDQVFEQLGWSRDAQTGAFIPPARVVQAVATHAASRPATTQAGGEQ
jgi:hypothetical protein